MLSSRTKPLSNRTFVGFMVVWYIRTSLQDYFMYHQTDNPNSYQALETSTNIWRRASRSQCLNINSRASQLS